MSFANLSPWDAYRWFDPPRETHINVGSAGTKQLCGREVRRVALIIAVDQSGSSMVISTMPIVGMDTGMVITGNAPLMLTHDSWGSLVQEAWYTNTVSASNAIIIEVLLRDYPRLNEDTLDAPINPIAG